AQRAGGLPGRLALPRPRPPEVPGRRPIREQARRISRSRDDGAIRRARQGGVHGLMTRTPLLWICGAPGVGKSAAAGEIFGRLQADGVRTGYVDTDQLGMCLPIPEDDPERTRLKARNLGAVVATFRQAGAERLIVSGVATAEEVAIFAAAAGGVAMSWV